MKRFTIQIEGFAIQESTFWFVVMLPSCWYWYGMVTSVLHPEVSRVKRTICHTLSPTFLEVNGLAGPATEVY